jgi:hypothetical protein
MQEGKGILLQCTVQDCTADEKGLCANWHEIKN